MKQRRNWLCPYIVLIVFFTIVSCDGSRNVETTAPPPATSTSTVEAPTAAPSLTPTDPPTPTAALTATHAPSATPSQMPTEVPTSTPTVEPTITPIPTYTVLRGEVLERSNCRYGPGAPYLYKYGLVVGSNLEVIGRNDQGTWILVQAIGGNNPCWVKASLMDVKGDVMSVAPTYIPLPQSPYYRPPTGVSASRNGNEVTIAWNPVSLRPGDETASPPYLVEAWVCTDGELIFTPIGSYEAMVTIADEPGCGEPSHGRMYVVEKHGYTRWVEVPWPAHE